MILLLLNSLYHSQKHELVLAAFYISCHPLIHGLQYAYSVYRRKHQLNVLQIFKHRVCWTVVYMQQDLPFL